MMSCPDSTHSTTRRVTTQAPNFDAQANEKFESLLYSNNRETRQGEGGLRAKGYFKANEVDKPLITIITAVFNGEQFLEETILSVINQTYDNVEYIIIDGGSTDRTLDIIKKYEHAIDYWVSEKDQGIADAFNKAVQVSTGDYINFQGDGDGFYELDSLEKIARKITLKKNIFVSGKICRTNEFGQPLYISKQQDPFNKKSLLFRMSLPHQGLFTHKDFFKQYGLFDTNNTYCMDYEHLLRAYSDFPEVSLINDVIANWRADGLGNGKTLEILKEYHQIKKANKVASSLSLVFIKYWTYFKYFIRQLIA